MSYYVILNIDPLSSMDEIKDSYNKIISTIEDEEKKNNIEKAYQTLSNYNSRRMYDNQSENNNLVNDVIASNDEAKNEFFLNNENESFQIDNQNNFGTKSSFVNQSFEDNFSNKLISINQRLEQIERKIDTNKKTNFYREKKYVREVIKDNKKIISIDCYINDNGYKNKSSKVIEYEDGKKTKMFFPKNKNSKKLDSESDLLI